VVTTDAGVPERVRGMRDLLPAEMDRVRAIESAFAVACRAWGYREIRTPVIEPLHLFTAAGTLSPRTLDSVYSFLDWDGWSGERVVLRPDSTIPAARLYTEHLSGPKPAKLFYRQNVFRFRDDDSSREEWQCGVELIGDTGVAGDVELILLALEALAPLRLPPLSVRLSHAGLVRAALAATGLSPDEQSATYDRLLDGDGDAVAKIEARVDAPLRLLFDVEGAGSGYLSNLRAALMPSIPALEGPLDNLTFVVKALEAHGVAPIVQAALARSFEYYSGCVFKVFAGDRRICSGGRYDELLGLVGGAGVPASGFAVYVDATEPLMPVEASAAPPVSVLVSPEKQTPELVASAQDAAARLRAGGVSAYVIEGLDLTPTHRLIVRADQRLEMRGSDELLGSPDDVLRLLSEAS
jgi:histidyl-tRNA synthetase